MVNISSYELTAIECQTLAKGLSFCPMNKMRWFDLDLELRTFFRNVRLKSFFSDKNTDTLTSNIVDNEQLHMLHLRDFGLRNKSKFNPPHNNHVIEAFIELVSKDVALLRHSKKNYKDANNLTYAERNVLTKLTTNESITIRPADKGGALVVMDTSKYINEILRQTNDDMIYEQLGADPTLKFQKELFEIIDVAVSEQLMDTELCAFLKIVHPVVPLVYVLPKIHKNLIDPTRTSYRLG